MFQIEFEGQIIEVKPGANLRRSLKSSGLNPHNRQAQWLNCKGLGTCGTCAIEVLKGSPGPKTSREKWRLNFPPHQENKGLRLACQIEVNSDLKIAKHPGFWGEGKP